MRNKIPILELLVLVLSFALTVYLGDLRGPAAEEHKYLNPPPEHVELFHFGFRESMADSLWLRWIQDGDYCQTYQNQAPVEPVKPKPGEFYNPRHKYCDNSWSFKMLDAVTMLSPKFKMPYLAGAMTLSVLTEDYTGAKVLFDRSVEAFPDDWNILYHAAYHYLFDLNDLPRAAALLDQAGNHGAPQWVHLLAARLYSKAGKAEMGIRTLLAYRKTLKDEKAIQDVDKRLEEYKKQLDE